MKLAAELERHHRRDIARSGAERRVHPLQMLVVLARHPQRSGQPTGRQAHGDPWSDMLVDPAWEALAHSPGPLVCREALDGA
jgi:hypothetical protein